MIRRRAYSSLVTLWHHLVFRAALFRACPARELHLVDGKWVDSSEDAPAETGDPAGDGVSL